MFWYAGAGFWVIIISVIGMWLVILGFVGLKIYKEIVEYLTEEVEIPNREEEEE